MREMESCAYLDIETTSLSPGNGELTVVGVYLISEIDAPPLSKEVKKRWSYFIRKVYETDPLTCPKCQGEMRIISFIDQPDVVQKILEHLGLWEESQAPPHRGPLRKELTFDSSYGSINSPSRGRSRDSQLL